MKLSKCKTKIVCTIGPASESPDVMTRMIEAGMNVARLNFSHGDFESHKQVIENLRAAAGRTGQRLAIMADLPGPKMRIGQLANEPLELKPGDPFTLTTEDVTGGPGRVSVSFEPLPRVVQPGSILFLNDGLIQLEVVTVENKDIHCRVLAGGELRSRKGLNVPNIDLGVSAFTERDQECLKFALDNGVDAVSQSFVESSGDIVAVRKFANALGYNPFIVAKIERSRALEHLDSIIHAADGIMVARGDLGVEIPIERIAVVQKQITHSANIQGKPVITATQMLESMVSNRRPTRAEATDVANAVLDGTDCVMLSEESAMGAYPVEAVTMLAKIAAAVEPSRPGRYVRETLNTISQAGCTSLTDLIAKSVETVMEQVFPTAVFVPTRSGATARSIARFRPPVWLIAVSSQEATCQLLQFSYGVYPLYEKEHPEDWKSYTKQWLDTFGIEGDFVVLTEGPSQRHPEANNRMEFILLKERSR
jgi:pyruvate kinase